MGNKSWVKILRTVGVVLMALTAAFTIMGGAGTSCVAINPTGFGGSFTNLASYQWLYILFVMVTFAFGVMGARAVFLLTKARANAYRYSLIALIGGSIVGVIHIIVSRSLRGSSMPVDMVTYTSLLTLVVFLIFRLPGIWKFIDFSKPFPSQPAGISGGLAAISSGAIALTIQYWVGSTHTINGVNYADAWHAQLQLIGGILLMTGAFLLLWSTEVFRLSARKNQAAQVLE